MAFLDDNINSQTGSIVQNIGSQTVFQSVLLRNPKDYVPNAAVFLNGVNQIQTPTANSFEYHVQIHQIYITIIELQFSVAIGFRILQLDYNIIYGSSQYLQTGQWLLQSLGTIQLFTTNTKTKLSYVGLSLVFGTGDVRVDIINNAGSVYSQTWSGSTLTQVMFVYFKYMPCPLYCTTCYAASPNCDACLPSTFRIGSACTSCQAHMFLILGQMNCQDCAQQCDSCQSSNTNCTICRPSTLRINLPTCNLCPSQMFILDGIDKCQQCANYCNGCISQSDNCSSCLSSSQRTNPPSCSTCPAQYYVMPYAQNCQQCSLLCNNCLNFSSLCIACNSRLQRLNPPDCITCPQYTYVNGNTCTQCDRSCQTCNSNTCLTCLAQQYINSFGKCINCPQHCLNCDADTCYSCAGNCLQCNFISCEKCLLDNSYIQGTDCHQCPLNCSTCDATQCFTCIGPRIVINNQCECEFPCSTCDSYQCLTCISVDYRIQAQSCQFCPQRCVACDPQGYCYTEPLNCSLGIYINSEMIQCTYCESNYYLSNNVCIQCSLQCLGCLLQPQNCTNCRFQNLDSQKCILCESLPGLYSDYISNTCYSICGDGIIAKNEQCDDGNNYSRDGCSNCYVDPGYQCFESICELIVYPTPQINQNLIMDSLYKAEKEFYLTYNVPIVPITLDIEISIKNVNQFTYKIDFIDYQHFVLTILLLEEAIDSEMQVEFLQQNSIISEQGIQQEIKVIQCSISNFYLISSADQTISDSNSTMMQYIFILFTIIVGVSIIFGGLDTLWNLLDILQTISYLKYINTDKPYYLYTFFNLFGFLQFQNLPMNSFFNIQNYFQNLIHTNEQQQPPQLISNDGYSSSSIINVIPILSVVLTGICIFILAKIILYINHKMICNFNIQYLPKSFQLTKYLNNLKNNVISYCNSIVSQWIWSGIIRIYISSAYEITFMICLGINGLQIQNSSELIQFNCFLTIYLAFTYLAITFLLSIIASFNYVTLKLKDNEYGAVCEGLNLHKQTKLYNIILLIKKAFFMVCLVLLYDQPIFQIFNIIAIQLSQLLFLLISSPIKNRQEMQKQIICDFFMLFAEIQLSILVIDDYISILQYNGRKVIGLICIGSLVIILVTQILFDTYQQGLYYYVKYSFIRRFVQKLRNIFKTQTNI